MESNKSDIIYHMNATYLKPQGPVYYIVYTFLSILGTVANLMLFYAVHKKLGLFGYRCTFTYLVKIISILDVLLAVLIICDEIVMQFVDRACIYEYFIHPRNLVLVYESYTLLIIAADRYVAIQRPFSSSWNCDNIRRTICLLFVLTALVDAADIAHKIVFPYVLNRGPNIYIYRMALTVFFIVLLILTSVVYIMIYIRHFRYTHKRAAKLQLVKRQQSSNNQNCSVDECRSLTDLNQLAMDNLNQQDATNNSNPDNNIDASIPLNEGNVTQATPVAKSSPYNMIKILQQSNNNNNNENASRTNSTRRVSHEVGERRSNNNNSMRLLLIITTVTGVYVVTLIPHMLAGWQLVQFPGYLIYNMYYLNAVVNPFIYLCSDIKLRNCLVQRLSKNFVQPNDNGKAKERRIE